MGNDVQKTEEAAVSNSEREAELKNERRKKNRRFNTVLYCIAGALVLVGVFIILRSETTLFTRNSANRPQATPPSDSAVVVNDPTAPVVTAPAGTKDPAAATPTYPPPAATPEPAPEEPVSIYFYGHDVGCKVQPVGVDENGVMEAVPSPNIVGWYKYGSAPNQQGNCIIAGHNRYSGQMGSFSLLHKGLEVGDTVAVTLADGSTCFYIVRSIDTYRYNEVPDSVMASGGEKRLTLITCLGDYDYDMQMSVSRVVAVCIPVE